MSLMFKCGFRGNYQSIGSPLSRCAMVSSVHFPMFGRLVFSCAFALRDFSLNKLLSSPLTVFLCCHRWEVFSLGATPYPGNDSAEDLVEMLLDGDRMDKPVTSTQKASQSNCR